MIKRETPRRIPDKPHYHAIECETNGAHHFRIPFFVKAAAIIERASPPTTTVGKMEEIHRGMSRGAYMLGLCWHHEHIDLETSDRHADKDPEAYGSAILDELYEEGYTTTEMGELVTGVAVLLKDSIIDSAAVKKKADFSEAGAATGSC